MSHSVTPWTAACLTSALLYLLEFSNSCPWNLWCYQTISSSQTCSSYQKHLPALLKDTPRGIWSSRCGMSLKFWSFRSSQMMPKLLVQGLCFEKSSEESVIAWYIPLVDNALKSRICVLKSYFFFFSFIVLLLLLLLLF